MKKKITFFVLLLYSIFSFSQITIERADVYDIGDNIPLIRYYPPTSSGSNFTDMFGEDAPTFGNIDWQNKVVDTLRFFDPEETDLLNQYPEANCSYMNEDGFIIHMNISNEDVTVLGLQAQQPLTGDPMSMVFVDSLITHIFPLSFEDQHTDTGIAHDKSHISEYEDIIPPDYYGFISALYDTLKIQVDLSIDSDFDEFGTMILTADEILHGNFQYLREKRIYVTYVDAYLRSQNTGNYTPVGDLFGDELPMELPMIDSIYSLNYWAKEYKYPLVELHLDSNFENVVQVNYRYCDKSFVDNKKYMSHSVYPNPVVGELNFQLGGANNLTVNIYTQTGTFVDRVYSKSGHLKYDTSKLPSGNYVYQIEEKSGKAVATGNFVVLK